MARKAKSRTRPGERSNRRAADSADTAQAVRDSAQKIWLAGLGAFERARTEGPRMFETLVEQGRNMGARAVGMADDALKNMRQADYSGGRWDKLEQVFEDRVSKSLSRLGVLTTREVEDLARQVRELNESVQNLMTPGGSAGTTRKSSRAAGARAGAKRKAKSKAKAKARSPRKGATRA